MISRHLFSVLYYGVSYMNQINSLIAQLARWKKKKKTRIQQPSDKYKH